MKYFPIKSHQDESDSDTAGSTQVLTRPEHKVQEPPMYKVLLLNDDFTPMDFVVHILIQFFKKSEPEASKVMMQVHNEGAGLAGIYSFEIAETKVYQVNNYAQQNEHPLKCIMEKDE